MLFDSSIFSISSSSTATSDSGSSSQSFGSATVITPTETQTVSSSTASDNSVGSSAQASASTSASGSSVTATTQSTDSVAEGNRPLPIAAPLEVFNLFPELDVFRGAVVNNALAQSIANAVVGNDDSQVLVATVNQDSLIGYGAADTFVLGTDPISDLALADVIVDFSVVQGDRIGLSGISFNDLLLQPIDLDNNGLLESTLIQLGSTGLTFAIALNTVDPAGNSLLTAEQFLVIPHSSIA
jgi:hypothetical protein